MTTSGHALRSRGAETKDAPTGGMLHYYTIDYYHVIQFFESLEKCFSSSEEVFFNGLTNLLSDKFSVFYVRFCRAVITCPLSKVTHCV